MAKDVGALQTGGKDVGALQSTAAASQQITPDSITSGASLGNPTLVLGTAPQTIAPNGIGPGSSLGAPELIGPQVIAPSGIGPGSSLGEPTLIGAPVEITPAGISSTAALGEPRLANVLTIRPDSLESTAALGEPSLLGQERVVFLDGIGPGATLGAPTLSGGETGLQAYVAGVNRTRWLRRGTLSVRSQTRGRWSASAEFHNAPNGYPHLVDTADEWIRPKVGMTVLITEYGRNVFRGCISEVEIGRLSPTHTLTYTVRMQDKAWICDHRLSRRVYGAEEDAADVIRDLLTNSLNQEGIALDAELPASLGALGTPIQAYVTVTQAFDSVSNSLGRPWFIDINQVLHFVDPTAADAAPFTLTETSRNYLHDSLTVRETLTDYRNREIVVSNRRLDPGDGTTGTPGSRTETYTLLDAGGGQGYQEQARAYDFPLPDGYIVTEFPIGSVLEVKINGVASDAYLITDHAWEVFIESSGFLVQAWFWTNPGARFIAPVINPGNGAVIEITYTPYQDTAAQSTTDPLTVTASSTPLPGELAGGCGSGIFEHVTQVNDVSTEDEANALASKFLEKFSTVPVEISFETDYAGLEVGQRLTVNIPRYAGLLDTAALFITNIRGRTLDGDSDLGHLTAMRFQVTADNIGDRGNYLKFWEDFYARTRHGTPEANARTAIVLGPGSSIVDGVNFTNPGLLEITGRLVKIVAIFEDPPTDQDLIIDIMINGVSILDSQKIRIPDGETDQLEFANFASARIQGYAGDVVRVSTSYEVTGANPVAAMNGSVYLLWSA